ncbi:MAG: MFS transporter, partial [Actinobacteria bacterium]|nr:MFS transporter [Actinomycetota bacterium]
MSSTAIETGTIKTKIPSRLDRLPWARFHWRVLLGLGTAWILDGLEVTIVGTVAARMTEHGSGISISVSQIGTAGAIYVVGACLGALFFGQLTDRFGRKKLFLWTLGLYLVATAATAGSFNFWYFFAARFFTGAGIGGEYAAINSAIDELIPARARGRVDLIINGSFWVGAMAGSAASIALLNTAWLPADIGWRLGFVIGVILAIAVMLVRRHVPESPRWLFIHGREEEAEAIVAGIERSIQGETGQPLRPVSKELTVRQRKTIPFREIARVGFRVYPKRSVLALALFVGQAFIYNGITFNLGTMMGTFFKVSSSVVPIFLILYAAANFAGPLSIGRLFDTVGRRPMISLTYLGSAVLGVALAATFAAGVLNSWTFIGFVMATFFLASAGASAAYLTASEIFPMETRALAIAFFYAIGTAAGGVSGPLLFGNLISTGKPGDAALAFYIGSGVMALGGIAEIAFGVAAERQQLEDIAKPLTVEEAEQQAGQAAGGAPAQPA